MRALFCFLILFLGLTCRAKQEFSHKPKEGTKFSRERFHRRPCEPGTHLQDGLCIKYGNRTHTIDPRFTFLANERGQLNESFSWNNVFLTNISNRLPADFMDPQFEIMSIRQLEFDDMNRHSNR